jgi:aerobic carbon-monoxide dehydrogenase medium subunit
MIELVEPATLPDALRELAQSDSRPLAGGVAILLRRQLSGVSPGRRFVSIGHLPELRAIDDRPSFHRDDEGPSLVVGAAVTVAELARSRAVERRIPLLAVAARAVANPGIRSTATLGGNLLDQPAGSDLAAAALALGGEAIWAAGPDASAKLELAALLDRSADSRPVGLLVGIRFPVGERSGWGFERLQTRGVADRPVATVAVVLPGGPDPTGAAAWASWIGDRTVDLSAALPETLAGGSSFAAAIDTALAGCRISDDARASAAYRRRVIPVLLRRAAERAASRRDAAGQT